jgi:predicted NAD-dependent protein-ADP-ribosyltransferase YbiA (DUF1768 family)
MAEWLLDKGLLLLCLVEAQKQEQIWSIGCHGQEKYDNSLFIRLISFLKYWCTMLEQY